MVKMPDWEEKPERSCWADLSGFHAFGTGQFLTPNLMKRHKRH
jgi:hypothetical protein